MWKAAAPNVAWPEGARGMFSVRHVSHLCLGSSFASAAAAEASSSAAATERLVGGSLGGLGKNLLLRMFDFGAPRGSQYGSASSEMSLSASGAAGPHEVSCSRMPTTGRQRSWMYF